MHPLGAANTSDPVNLNDWNRQRDLPKDDYVSPNWTRPTDPRTVVMPPPAATQEIDRALGAESCPAAGNLKLSPRVGRNRFVNTSHAEQVRRVEPTQSTNDVRPVVGRSTHPVDGHPCPTVDRLWNSEQPSEIKLQVVSYPVRNDVAVTREYW